MSKTRSTFVMPGEHFFEPGIPIYVNRACETFEMAEHSHEFIEITYVSEGSGVHYIAGDAVPVEHGTLFFIPIGRSHVFRPRTMRKDRPLIVYNCLFPARYLVELRDAFPHASELCEPFIEQRVHWFSMRDDAGEYHALFREMHREFSARPPGYLGVLAALVVRILAGLYRHQLQLGSPERDRPQWLSIDEAVAYIDRHYASSLRLGDFAAKANLSERQFSRLFRKQTGMSFTEYVQGIRMDAACRQLAASHQSVAEIASEVGYSDLKFFHQLFKKKIGVTPRQYRQQARSTS
ncbi:AraC family transcriptional regulator [Paenibacillus campinasensis]|uniref:AraC family transcriptional regulator n=1 Tax=Paenibacillus campinasensis TaxID=66347 RepID=A0A268ERF9_9BACL|nr:AraC family transcriptional regulator [Paenibacillus campinasensis]MUG66776.1 helix-turn-helix domain-containing protein [Paenibacillus campinasensis]PAD75698.1 AraC family transcriptional regulator [Paenibacillus campinasensis]